MNYVIGSLGQSPTGRIPPPHHRNVVQCTPERARLLYRLLMSISQMEQVLVYPLASGPAPAETDYVMHRVDFRWRNHSHNVTVHEIQLMRALLATV